MNGSTVSFRADTTAASGAKKNEVASTDFGFTAGDAGPWLGLLTTYYLLLTTYYLLLTAYCLLLTAYYLFHTTHYSLLTTYY